MIPVLPTITKLMIGSSIGYIYGLCFVYSQSKVLSFSSKSSYLLLFFAGVIRIAIFTCFTFLLLRVTQTDLILFQQEMFLYAASCFTVFWIAISKGNTLYGGSWSR